MLEITTSQARPRAEWHAALRQTIGRRTSNGATARRNRDSLQYGQDVFQYGTSSHYALGHGSDTSRSPASRPLDPNIEWNPFTDQRSMDAALTLASSSYQGGARYTSGSGSPIADLLAMTSPSSPQTSRGNRHRSPLESFSPISNESSESRWPTSHTPQFGSDVEDMTMSDVQFGSLGAINSMMMPSPSTVSAGISESYVDVGASFLPPDAHGQLDDLIFTHTFLPISPSGSLNFSPVSPRNSEDIALDQNHAPAGDGFTFNGIPISMDVWPDASLSSPRLNLGDSVSRSSVGDAQQVPWDSFQQPLGTDYGGDGDLTHFSAGLMGSDPYGTNGSLSPDLFKVDLEHASSPGLPPSDGSWALVSRTNSDAPSYGSPCSHRSPEAHPGSPVQSSQPEYDRPHAHVLNFKNNSKIAKLKLPKGRQRGLTAAEKKQARDVRDAKACWACHISKTKCSPCSPGRPCEQCARLDGKRRFCNFSCFNDPLEALHKFMVPDYLMGHFTRQDVEAFVVRNASGWGTEALHIKMTWGFRRPLEAKVLRLVLRSDSHEMGYHHQTIQTNNSSPMLVRKQSPPLGIPLEAMDDLPGIYSQYIQGIVTNDLLEYVRVAYPDQETQLPERVLRAVCQFYHSESETDSRSDLLRQAIEMHVVAVILERSLVLEDDSLADVETLLQQEFPPRSAPRCAQRQIKLALFEHQQIRIMNVLKDWGNMMWATNTPLGKDKDWAVSFSVFVILILVMDKTLGAAYFFSEGRIKNHGHEARSEQASFAELVRLTQNELFDRCKEIFHWKFKTRKAGKEACNPIRDGVGRLMAKAGNAVDENVATLVRDVREVVREYEDALKSPIHKRHGIESEYMDAGRLTCIFLNDFISR